MAEIQSRVGEVDRILDVFLSRLDPAGQEAEVGDFIDSVVLVSISTSSEVPAWVIRFATQVVQERPLKPRVILRVLHDICVGSWWINARPGLMELVRSTMSRPVPSPGDALFHRFAIAADLWYRVEVVLALQRSDWTGEVRMPMPPLALESQIEFMISYIVPK